MSKSEPSNITVEDAFKITISFLKEEKAKVKELQAENAKLKKVLKEFVEIYPDFDLSLKSTWLKADELLEQLEGDNE